MSNKLELLSGPAIEQALAENDATVFRYEVNQAGLIIAMVVACFFFVLGGVTWWQTGLDDLWAVAFVAIMGIGMGFTAVAAYWHQFATQNLLAVSDERLFVGGPKATWSISWDLLDRKAMGFEDMQMTRLRGGLQLNVAGQRIQLHLFNVIAYLSDIEGFIGGVLTHLPQLEGEEAAAMLEEE